jgi:drug/metabolite transporter (DMT)-like permease
VLIFWRFLFTSLSFIPIMMFYKGSYRLNSRSILPIILGAVFIVTYNKFFFWGLQYGLAGAGGVLVTTLNPILTFLFTIVFFRKHVSLREFSGLILGFAGGAVLLEVWGINLNQLFRSGNAYFLFASMAWALLTLTSEKSRSNLPPLVFSFYVFSLSAFLDFFLALPLGIDRVLTEDWLFWTNILYLSVFATTFATTIYFAASGRLGSRRASSYIFLVPASAVLISWVLLGEQPRLSTLIGGLIALSAVYLINVSPKGSPQAHLSASNQ